MSKNAQNHLGLFAKFWQPGLVKTRLAASIGDEKSCDLYFAFLNHLINKLSDIGTDRRLVYSPPERETCFREIAPNSWGLYPQSTGGLGARMHSFFSDQFKLAKPPAHCVRNVVIIGADCPQIKSATVERAFEELERASVVIGPSVDGGYYLLGMREACFDIFADIEWSTSTVLASTIAHLQRQDLDFTMLQPMEDVDELNSLLALEEKMTNGVHEQASLTDAGEAKLLEQVRFALGRSG
jgi:rSAM/selenodomain-associated transferase 1